MNRYLIKTSFVKLGYRLAKTRREALLNAVQEFGFNQEELIVRGLK